ncbi:MAG TPA: sigma-E factor regulatory protein RseB domain-containing protein [Streptosporangiaceae bacterium]|nr:sigma-E factor regulatory protein RseB domain-containing protein [Streptosporangiaceae bacterium]
MLWLYWRRSRLIIAVAAAAVGAVTGLALLADTLAGSDPMTAQPAAMGRPGGPQPRTTTPSADDPQVRRGLLLMHAAAVACQSVSFRGVQIVAWSSPAGSSSYLIDVWHRHGEPELAATDGDSDDSRASGRLPGSSAGAGAVGVLSMSSAMLTVLRENYLVEYAGMGSSSDRPARIVVVRRHDGTLAAQYWLDRDTSLPLRREMFDESGRRVSEGAFIDLEIGIRGIGTVPAPQGQAWDTFLPSQQTPRSRANAARIRTLRAQGWPVPGKLAGNMALASVSRTGTRSGQVLDASYSDGLSVVSLFMQRGELSGALPGWHRVNVHGVPVYSTESGDLDEQGLAWSAGGFVYTVIADAPPQAVSLVIAELPHAPDSGFWQRVARGIRRIGSWFDPFG